MTDNNNPNPEPTTQPNEVEVLDKFKEIKENYETQLTEKDKQIKELQKQLKEKDKQVNDTIQDLNQEVDEKLKQSEEYQKLLRTVEELEKDKAKATVDKYIQEGKLLPAQKDTALEFAINQPDKFIELYENAPRIIQTEQKSRKPEPKQTGKLLNYFNRRK